MYCWRPLLASHFLSEWVRANGIDVSIVKISGGNKSAAACLMKGLFDLPTLAPLVQRSAATALWAWGAGKHRSRIDRHFASRECFQIEWASVGLIVCTPPCCCLCMCCWLMIPISELDASFFSCGLCIDCVVSLSWNRWRTSMLCGRTYVLTVCKDAEKNQAAKKTNCSCFSSLLTWITLLLTWQT